MSPLIAAVIGAGLISTAPASSAEPAARAARTANIRDEARLHVIHSNGELLTEEGPATGALPGRVRVRFRVSTTISGTFTIYPRSGGSITGQGFAHLHSTGVYASFGGTTTVSHGTARYSHVHGHGGFYGTVNRHNDTLIIQTTGQLSY
jgi:hypothetical protein